MSPVTENVGVQSDSLIKNSLLQAKQLNDAKWIYGVYGALDGLSTSFSMLKYGFKLAYTNSHASSSDVLRNWSLSPLGIAIIAIESAVLIGCSVIGNTMDDDGYYLHCMPLDNARQLNHVNCYVWNEQELVYIAPDGTETVFTRPGDLVNAAFIKKLKNTNNPPIQSLHLSIKQADDLLLTQEAPFYRASPTLTFTGAIASYWSYVRDALKAMKNTDTAIRNTFVITDLLIVGRNYHYLVTPVGLAMGVFAACNRIWLRYIRDERKSAKKLNIDLLEPIVKSLSIAPTKKNLQDIELLYQDLLKEHERIADKIRPPSHSQFFWLYTRLSGAFSGLIDSPYLYFGALSLTISAPTSLFFIFVATTSFIFAMTCIATRVFEEQNFQRELLVSQLEVELAMAIEEVRLLREHMRLINEALSSTHLIEQEQEQKRLNELFAQTWLKSKIIRDQFTYQSELSFGFIFMSGLKNGLDTYGALASLMFLIATINLVLLVPYSPVIVLSFVSMGLASLMIAPTVALIHHYFPHWFNSSTNTPDPDKTKSALEHFSELEREIDQTTPAEANIMTPMIYEGALEVARGACSGAGKGIRGVEQVLSAFQELGEDGHYHDTDSMFIFAWINAILFAITFGLRGFARLGRGVKEDKPKEKKPDDKNSGSLDSPGIKDVNPTINDVLEAPFPSEPNSPVVSSKTRDSRPSPHTIISVANLSTGSMNQSFFNRNSSARHSQDDSLLSASSRPDHRDSIESSEQDIQTELSDQMSDSDTIPGLEQDRCTF